MNGTEKWEQEEKVLPSLASRPAVPTLTSQFNKLMLQQQLQQMQLQQGSTMSNAVSRCSIFRRAACAVWWLRYSARCPPVSLALFVCHPL
jgi:hypothetical protein